ncbi:hypothetical protein UFOVP33_67 [uncultured Caudovirales phage]|uniref:Uncharacterized protein n=1 Tax=uncultured Caudovirales phage TaxID=2100421 RepID=A0A6J5KKS7_9CAUD|nr:hypothetical protein UFOVP33_67 [uncultured Caudovirales phage]
MADFDLDNLSTDPEELAKVFNQLEAGDTPVMSDPKPADPAPGQDDANKVEPTATNPQQDAQGTAEPDGVATKDGKNVIPYGVLKSERERASRAEQLANEMKERVTALEAMVKAANEGAKPGESARTSPAPVADDLSSEDLEALKEDFPTVYKAVMASMAKAAALESKLNPVEESVRNAEAEQARTATETVQDTIDSIPKLAHIQSANPEAFELAKQFDATLRGQAKWANSTLAERFNKVTEMVEAALGEIELPGKANTSQPSAEDLRNAALAKAASAAKANKTAVPTSLSEFPVGDPAAKDEREAAENMTPLQLAQHLNSMSPDQMDAYFQSL